MKQIILIVFLSILIYAKPAYWVQVIAVKHPSSITHAFLQKIQKSKKGYKTIYNGGYKKVLIGSFKTSKRAKIANIFFKHYVAKDAFVTKYSIHKIKKNKKISIIPRAKVVTIKLASSRRQNKILKHGVVNKDISKIKDIVAPVVASCISLCKKSRTRQSEIASAIRFYRHSKYYKFIN